jgi:dihydrofolate reductase
MTRSADFRAADCTIVGSLDEACAAARGQAKLMVIGGAEIYRQCMERAMRIHLTLVHARVEDGDAFFCEWRGAAWRELSCERHEADERNDHAFSFITLDRAPRGSGQA